MVGRDVCEKAAARQSEKMLSVRIWPEVFSAGAVLKSFFHY
jgi:hypothetical protein